MQESFNRLYKIIKTLIAPDGCPWDSVQTPNSMKRYLVEETFEALEAIKEENAEHIKEELGDVIMNAVEVAALCEKQGKFSVDDVLNSASEKLIRRHPHVFENKEISLAQLDVQWDKIKKTEGKKEKLSNEEKYNKIQELLESIAPEYGVEPHKTHYYIDDSDYVFAEKDNRIYSYNYKKKMFVLTDNVIDPMKWHEFPESELEEKIKQNEHLFKCYNNDTERK